MFRHVSQLKLDIQNEAIQRNIAYWNLAYWDLKGP
jgi:hypothetical protein